MSVGEWGTPGSPGCHGYPVGYAWHGRGGVTKPLPPTNAQRSALLLCVVCVQRGTLVTAEEGVLFGTVRELVLEVRGRLAADAHTPVQHAEQCTALALQ